MSKKKDAYNHIAVLARVAGFLFGLIVIVSLLVVGFQVAVELHKITIVRLPQ